MDGCCGDFWTPNPHPKGWGFFVLDSNRNLTEYGIC
jgi:hypothetical protein